KFFTVVSVERFELTGQLTGEYDSARSRQYSGETRDVAGCLPFRFAGHGVDGLEVAARTFRPVPQVRKVHAEIPFARLVSRRLGLVVAAEGERVGVGKA